MFNPKNPPSRPPPDSHIWISCTDHHFSFQENHVTSPGIVINTLGNQVTDDVIARIKKVQLEAGKKFHVSVLGHTCCVAITGGCYCQPGETPSSTLVRQNLRVQMDKLIQELEPKFEVNEVPEGDHVIHPSEFRGDSDRPDICFPTPFSGDGDGGNVGFWAWVLEADGLFHHVWIAGPRDP
ncbi:hypothetical protein BDN72DRAFT_848411 [Pluteus cervinus]|uniref:Uncharacterized protein n=1 Tax=Pluteus cervinus TaxID=181527 RepID=A0ACD3AAV5_9AGAR|nr:hypothetical protein BDN72DRAFT_848411 [Pluteus cervinus]